MADRSAIEWTDASLNPIRARHTEVGKIGWHCEHVSEGCRNCYAEKINHRLGTGVAYKPGEIRQLHEIEKEGVEIFLDEKILTQPLKWRKPRKIFWGSMTDIAGRWVTDGMLDRMFAVMALTPQHTHQVLTKRPERLRQYLSISRPWGGAILTAACNLLGRDPGPFSLPLPNVWLGTSCEDQATADERIPHLLRTPAAVRFVSCEPLLGPIDLTRLRGEGTWRDALGGRLHTGPGILTGEPRLGWVIIGGESGRGARPHNISWDRSLIDQCKAAGVPCFEKQLGRRPYWDLLNGCGKWPRGALTRIELDGRQVDAITLKDKKGGDWNEWPADLRVREFPQVSR